MIDDQSTNADLVSQIRQLRQEVADLHAAQHVTRKLPRLLGRSGLIAAVCLMSVVLVGGAAFASIPSPSGVIKGCYDKFGALSVIDSASTATCSSKTTALTWNATGVQGPQGIQGPQGPQGIQGPQGPAGATNPLICPHCDMSKVTLPADASGAYFPVTNFRSADLTNANLDFADLQGADMEFLTAQNVNLFRANLSDTIVGGDLTGAVLVGVNFNGADVSTTNLTSADLATATGLTSSTTSGVTWSHTICPDGSNSDFDGSTCVGHGVT